MSSSRGDEVFSHNSRGGGKIVRFDSSCRRNSLCVCVCVCVIFLVSPARNEFSFVPRQPADFSMHVRVCDCVCVCVLFLLSRPAPLPSFQEQAIIRQRGWLLKRFYSVSRNKGSLIYLGPAQWKGGNGEVDVDFYGFPRSGLLKTRPHPRSSKLECVLFFRKRGAEHRPSAASDE